MFDAFSASEALYLSETETVDVVVIAAGVEDPELLEVRQKLVTLELTNGVRTSEVLWKLHLLFSARETPMQ